MANCVSCSAPLPGRSNICKYCGRRNDTDLHGIHQYTVVRPETERTCPRCNVPLHTINFKTNEKFYIERCDQCMGLFFDSGELEALLEQSVSNVFYVDRLRLDVVNKELYSHDQKMVKYLKCPVGGEYMRRVNFGAKSGVVVDRCRNHGIWLDGGELKRLLEWKKAGGQLLHEQLNQKKQKQAKRAQTGYDFEGGSNKQAAKRILTAERRKRVNWDINIASNHGFRRDDDLVTSVFRLIDKLF
jgi:Zn-finger nucleic acid-binding protein